MEKPGFQLTGEASQSSQRSTKHRRQLCIRKSDSQEKSQSQRDPLRWIRKENVPSPSSVPVKAEPERTPRKIKKEEEAIVIDLCSDEEEERLETNLEEANKPPGSSQRKIGSEQVHASSSQEIPATATMIATEEVPMETIGSQNVADTSSAQTETAFGHDFLSQNGLVGGLIEEWQNGLMQDEEQDINQDLTDQDGMQELNADLFSMQMESPPAPFRFHDSSTSIEAETPNTTSSIRPFRSSQVEKGVSGVDVQAFSSDADTFLHATEQQSQHEDQRQGPSQRNKPVNETAQSQKPNADVLGNFFQMLLQHGQQNLVRPNDNTANEYIYIAEMTVNPISKKQLGKRKAPDLPRASRLHNLSIAQKLAEVPAVTADDEEENPFAGIPHYPTELPTVCHRCGEKNHELKMRCRFHKGGKVCGLYFCKLCCAELGDEEFQPYLEMYCCARCNQFCDCVECRKSRRKPSKASSKNASSCNRKRIPGQGNKTLTQAYYDSVRSVTARKKISQIQAMAVNSSSPPSSVGEDGENVLFDREREEDDEYFPSDREQSPTGSPWRDLARNNLTDVLAQSYHQSAAQSHHESTWRKTANRRHLSEGSDEGIRRYNESSESEDGRATPASSSVDSIFVSQQIFCNDHSSIQEAPHAEH